MEEGLQIFRDAKTKKTPFSVLMIDIDHFKKVNDEYGHGFGDQVLKILAEICQNTVRGSDIVGRLGGEEFTVILPYTALSGAVELAERLKQEVEIYPLKVDDHIFNFTVSIGATSYSEAFERFEDVLHTADMEMYKAKKLGRNRIVASS
jgi:diguanylate cyclase